MTDDMVYTPLDAVLIRAPLLPIDAYLSLSSNGHGEGDRSSALSKVDACLSDARVRRALAIGSGSLMEAIERAEQSGMRSHDRMRMQTKLLRYLIRMSTRPTPFGLFAGVALGGWGDSTTLALADTCARTRTRPDMSWLFPFVVHLESQLEIRRRLQLVANPAVYVHAGRIMLAEQASRHETPSEQAVSIRATGVAVQALAAAREPTIYPSIVKHVLQASPTATVERVDQLLTTLWTQTFLLTDLFPPLTCADPAGYVAARLESIGAGREGALLRKLRELAKQCDQSSHADSIGVYRSLTRELGGDSARESSRVQVDTALALSGDRISRRVGVEAARTAELLLSLSPSPYGPSYLAAYRAAFVSRYGPDRQVPLLELLDPNTGLGSPFTYGGSANSAAPLAVKTGKRSRTLLALAHGALHDRARVVELDDTTLEALRLGSSSDALPRSLDLNGFVVARSTQAIDAGQFLFVVGPNVGATAATRTLGRFADLLGRPAHDALHNASRAEELARRYSSHSDQQGTAQGGQTIWAELVYAPRSFHGANVAIRPAIRHYEIPVGVTPGVPASQVIPISELVVSVQDGRLCVRWTRNGADVIPCAGHMLNSSRGPLVARFLSEVDRDGVTQLSHFDWGPASNFPYLPRVQVGRCVLSLARWRIDSSTYDRDLSPALPSEFRPRLDAWRSRWDVPRHVYWNCGDNRLLLDLQDEVQVEDLRVQVGRLVDYNSITVEEALPGPDDVWTPGPNGRYVTEFVVSLAQRVESVHYPAPGSGEGRPIDTISAMSAHPDSENTAPRHDRAVLASPVAEHSFVTSVAPFDRLRPPGTEWLFVKLYCSPDSEEDLIAGPLTHFTEWIISATWANEWFFLRYSDPGRHVRVRFRGDPGRLTRDVWPNLCNWARNLMNDGIVTRFSLDTYEREIERYGGMEGVAVAEGVSVADSRAVAHLLKLIQTRTLQLDRIALAALTIDDLLASLGLDESGRLGWYKQHAQLRNEVGGEYRQRKRELRALLGNPQFLSTIDGGSDVAEILTQRRQQLQLQEAQLRSLDERRLLSCTPTTLYRSYVHMHCNRLIGVDQMTESRVLGLLLRTREGLLRAPRP